MSEDRFQLLRLLEAVLFASTEPLAEKVLKARLPEDADLSGLLSELGAHYANRGVHLTRIEDRWAFRTAPDLATRLQIERKVTRKLSRAAIETLAIIAYHQPVTRAEIEEIRGVIISKGTLDHLLEIGWIKPHGRRETPGRPVTWVSTSAFLEHFGLEDTAALPGVEELRAAGLLDSRAAISTLATQASAAGHAVPPEDSADEEAAAEELRGEAPGEQADAGADAPVDDDYESELLEKHGEPGEQEEENGEAQVERQEPSADAEAGVEREEPSDDSDIDPERKRALERADS
ncbi:MAG TPA: SMC-Scp complex subunit ScpB [Candidatus Cybelea sp.]|nr:SMC-Scp complex subunit ScpB [Candidatus Cybelea sp.]